MNLPKTSAGCGDAGAEVGGGSVERIDDGANGEQEAEAVVVLAEERQQQGDDRSTPPMCHQTLKSFSRAVSRMP